MEPAAESTATSSPLRQQITNKYAALASITIILMQDGVCLDASCLTSAWQLLLKSVPASPTIYLSMEGVWLTAQSTRVPMRLDPWRFVSVSPTIYSIKVSAELTVILLMSSQQTLDSLANASRTDCTYGTEALVSWIATEWTSKMLILQRHATA